MSIKPHYYLIFMLLLVPCITFAAGPFNYFGHGGDPDHRIINLPDVPDSQTQWMSFHLHTGTAFQDTKMHLAVGLKGGTGNVGDPRGRGLALGAVSKCNGIMIEDFTLNGLIGNGPGLINGTCHPFFFTNHSMYHVAIHVSKLNVAWWLYKFQLGGWVIQETGGCTSDAGVFCPEHPMDGNHGDLFVGSAFLDSGLNWSVTSWYEGRF